MQGLWKIKVKLFKDSVDLSVEKNNSYSNKIISQIDPFLIDPLHDVVSEKEYRQIDQIEDIVINGKQFDYVINNLGFRSETFSTLDKNKFNILYAGCSQTFGTGLPIDLIWHSHLTKQIDKIVSKEIQTYNLGMTGASIQYICRTINTFIDTYGKPDAVFILLPNISRDLSYSTIFKSFRHMDFENIKYIFSTISRSPYNIWYTIRYKHEDKLMQSMTNLAMLESICKAYGIDLYWASWAGNEKEIYKKFKFKYYVDLIEEYPIEDNIPKSDYWEVARDGVHFGEKRSRKIAEIFFKEYNNRHER